MTPHLDLPALLSRLVWIIYAAVVVLIAAAVTR